MGWKESWRRPAGEGEVLRLAGPLILSSAFVTLQLFLDRVFLSQYGLEHGAAALQAAMMFWTPFAVLFNTAGYVSTFVAQYFGAGRSRRIGSVVWQALYFAVLAGVAFMGLAPFAGEVAALGGHSPQLQELEATYLYCLCFSALPALLTAAASGFFAGRGDTWTVLWINAVGMIVNGVLDWLLIFGNAGFPEWGMAGAGWATVAGNWAAAGLALWLMFRSTHEAACATRSGWRFDPALFRRLLYFGVPAGLQWAIDTLAFTMFLVLIGRLGEVEAAATGIAVNLNLLAFLPTMGMAQAVAILVGQRLGEDQTDLAERSTWTGFRLAWLQMTAVAVLYVLIPGPLLTLFNGGAGDPAATAVWAEVGDMAMVLLRFVALYCLFDSMNLVFSFALRGAGDTRFVTLVALLLSFPVMVFPTWLSYRYGWGIYVGWGAATVYVVLLAGTFWTRFQAGKWKSMRVIEPEVVEKGADEESPQTEICGLASLRTGEENV
ncbi:MAG: MATE family efflux transporter [Gemmataceae bacterium]|nr:MATE family efflux transporter [Gemmataceae bacterium]